MEHEQILKLIENVDPTDTAKLDEIDARFWCYLYPYAVFFNNGLIGFSPKYTRSRDLLKKIRPSGLFINIRQEAGSGAWFCILGNGKLKYLTIGLPTEELAELHAIISAIAYDRGNKVKDNP